MKAERPKGTTGKGWPTAALALAVVILGVGMFALTAPIGSTTASSWRIEVVDNVGVVGRFTSIALDKNDWPHISYRDSTNDDLKYARWTGSEWKIETVDNENDVGTYTSIALDSSGYLHISYFDAGNKNLKYARWAGGEWRIETVDNGENVGQYTSIALDKNSYPHISYYDVTNRDLKYARWTGSEWRVETVDNENDVGSEASIALDSAGFPHISYHAFADPYGSLKYARWTGDEWEIEIVDNPPDPHYVDSAGRFTSIALDRNDYPHISYAENPARMDVNVNLKYARWTGEVWEIERVEGTIEWVGEDSVGWYTSIALDSNDYPHISHYNQTKRSLKYARWDGGEWQIETVDNEGDDVGRYTSIAIDSNDRPHISYYSYSFSSSTASLKYATIEVTSNGALGPLWLATVVMIVAGIGGITMIVKRKFLR